MKSDESPLVVHISSPYRPLWMYRLMPEGLRYIVYNTLTIKDAADWSAKLAYAAEQTCALVLLCGPLACANDERFQSPSLSAKLYFDQPLEDQLEDYYRGILCMLNNPANIADLVAGKMSIYGSLSLRTWLLQERVMFTKQKYTFVKHEEEIYRRIATSVSLVTPTKK